MTEVDIAVTIAPEKELSQSTIDDLIKFQDSIEIIECRIDQWVDFDVTHVSKVVNNIYNLNLGKKILITYRTSSQGGEGTLSYEAYWNALAEIINLKHIDLVDIEFEPGKSTQPLIDLIEQSKNKQIQVLLSYHDFNKTPALEALKHLYFKMHQLSPDYLKVAVMPLDKQDVLNLLSAMSATSDSVPQQVVGIAMSKLGVISRTAQGLFGGTVSYGCLDSPKAPGQIHVETLKQQLKLYE
ncbi:type I 3-dehydroquinate dehydratase [Staphylococcus equorum]|uniref:3-dehydroquinate dehydratase n=1 Tax=Staphylococcus equorum TaxID=246432 RepID=A0A9X4L8H8_9STAP|nr:type I 3-dehydroquinate dehydratase [Staphylococcus equorum]MDG0843098.1 type I 3-dehydroquinate dehydratase [Staphylococcus equorum]MDG0858950.1 type I 3-dehydroquinate dehydratase [Staphylococcus equorum]